MSRLSMSYRVRKIRDTLVRVPRRIARGVEQAPLHFWEREDYRRMIAELPGPFGMAAEQASMANARRLFREIYGGAVLKLTPLPALVPESLFTCEPLPGAPLSRPHVFITNEQGANTRATGAGPKHEKAGGVREWHAKSG